MSVRGIIQRLTQQLPRIVTVSSECLIDYVSGVTDIGTRPAGFRIDRYTAPAFVFVPNRIKGTAARTPHPSEDYTH